MPLIFDPRNKSYITIPDPKNPNTNPTPKAPTRPTNQIDPQKSAKSASSAFNPQNPTQTPETYPTNQPLSTLQRQALPEEKPTPKETILEGIIFFDDPETRFAQRTVQDFLDQLDEENLPLTRTLQRHIQNAAEIYVHARRANANTRPRDDGKAIPGTTLHAAERANGAKKRALEQFDTLLEKHRAEQALKESQDPTPTKEQYEAEQKERHDQYLHDLRIPIQGLSLDRQPRRLEALAKALNRLAQDNQAAQRRGEPIPYPLPNLDSTLFPNPSVVAGSPDPATPPTEGLLPLGAANLPIGS